mgnify:CR=1 FL=1
MDEKDGKKIKKEPLLKWRTKRLIVVYALICSVLVILGAHGLILINDKKTIMIFGDQDNFSHNISFALTYLALGVTGIICSWTDFTTYQEREKAGLFKS